MYLKGAHLLIHAMLFAWIVQHLHLDHSNKPSFNKKQKSIKIKCVQLISPMILINYWYKNCANFVYYPLKYLAKCQAQEIFKFLKYEQIYICAFFYNYVFTSICLYQTHLHLHLSLYGSPESNNLRPWKDCRSIAHALEF